MSDEITKALLEAVLFLSGDPVPVRELAKMAGLDESTAQRLVKEIAHHYAGDGRGVRLIEIGGGWQLCTDPEVWPAVQKALGERKAARLSQAALETLAVIAYRQPVTKGEIEQIRGVNVDGVVAALLERELIVEMGRKDVIGRPILYGVGERFLRHFGLKSIDELPDIDSLKDA